MSVEVYKSLIYLVKKLYGSSARKLLWHKILNKLDILSAESFIHLARQFLAV